ncbi:MAG TPA: DNRLRE domain-containing protein [Chthoniobacter sp.]|jgi:hypothetical protein
MRFSWLLFFLAFGGVAAVQAQQATLGVAMGTSINAGNPTFADGDGPGLFAGIDASGSAHRSLMTFDVSSIPLDATIISVQLTMTLAQVTSGGPSPVTIELHDILKTWSAGTAGAGKTISGSGGGFTAGTGDATWSDEANPSTPWTNPGGDFSSTVSGSTSVSSTLTSYTWSSAQMVADVQNWVDNPSDNFGWEIINDSAVSKSVYVFDSGAASSNQPSLVVDYTVPEPSAGWLAGMGIVAALLFCRWREFASQRNRGLLSGV